MRVQRLPQGPSSSPFHNSLPSGIRAYRPWTIGHIKTTIKSMERAADIGAIFGEVLRRHRSEKNISQEELAFLAGVDRTFISRLERGIRQPTITTMIGIGQALGVPAADLVRETEEAYLHQGS